MVSLFAIALSLGSVALLLWPRLGSTTAALVTAALALGIAAVAARGPTRLLPSAALLFALAVLAADALLVLSAR